MIEKAAKAEPDDGYITDSLGWVLYRLGRYQEAVAADAARGRAHPRRPGHQRPPRRRALDGRPQARGRVPVAPGAVASARPTTSTWTASARSSTSASTRCWPPSRSRTAEPRARAGGGVRPRQGQPRAARHRPPRRTAPPARQPRGLPPPRRPSSRPSPPPASRSRSTAPSPATSAPAPTTSCCAPRCCCGRAGRGAALRLDQVAAGRERHRRRLGRRRRDPAAARPALAGAAARRPTPSSRLGADVPVCLAGRACRMSRHRRAPRAARPAALLAGARQPRRAARDRRGLRRPRPPRQPAARRRRRPSRRRGARRLARRPAQRPRARRPSPLAPPIAEVLAALAAQPGCRLARMSGSGATCFGLFAAERPALAAAAALRRAGRPGGSPPRRSAVLEPEADQHAVVFVRGVRRRAHVPGQEHRLLVGARASPKNASAGPPRSTRMRPFSPKLVTGPPSASSSTASASTFSASSCRCRPPGCGHPAIPSRCAPDRPRRPGRPGSPRPRQSLRPGSRPPGSGRPPCRASCRRCRGHIRPKCSSRLAARRCRPR